MRYENDAENKAKDIENVDWYSLKINVWKIPVGVAPQAWADGIVDIYCRTYGFLERGKKILTRAVNRAYRDAGVMNISLCDTGWGQKVYDLSGNVTFEKIYTYIKDEYDGASLADAAEREGYQKILEKLYFLACGFEGGMDARLYGGGDGLCIGELIGVNMSSAVGVAVNASRIFNSLYKERNGYFIEKETYDFICSCVVFGCITCPRKERNECPSAIVGEE